MILQRADNLPLPRMPITLGAVYFMARINNSPFLSAACYLLTLFCFNRGLHSRLRVFFTFLLFSRAQTTTGYTHLFHSTNGSVTLRLSPKR